MNSDDDVTHSKQYDKVTTDGLTPNFQPITHTQQGYVLYAARVRIANSQHDYVRVVEGEASNVFSSTGAASERLTAQPGAR